MKPKRISFTPHTPDADGICAAQQAAGAGSLTLNGADVSGGVASFGSSADYRRVGYQVGIASSGNLSGVNFTVTGTDQHGDALSETIAGPNNNTVETTGYFKTVTSVTVDGAVGTNVTVGTVDEWVTATIPIDIQVDRCTLNANISGTINYTVSAAYERPTAGESPNWGDAIAATTSDASAVLSGCVGAIRAVGNSFTGGATFALNISQPRLV